jgi:hypothetical protein
LYQVSYDIHECNEKNIHKFHESASYKLLNNLVIFLLNKNNSRDCFYQFRLSILKVRFQGNKNNNKSEYEETDILTSPLYERLKNVE